MDTSCVKKQDTITTPTLIRPVQEDLSLDDLMNQLDFSANKTYRERLDELPLEDEIRDILFGALFYQDVLDQPMDGLSAQHRRTIEREGCGLNFSSIYDKTRFKNKFFTPCEYAAEIVEWLVSNWEHVEKWLKKQNVNYTMGELIYGMVGRGLRTLPSFFREDDLYCKIKANPFFKDAEIDRSRFLDWKFHADLMVTLDGHDFFIWSYFATEKGLPNLVSKIRGDRGELVDGNHIFCPVSFGKDKNDTDTTDTNMTEYHKWILYSGDFVNDVADVISNKKGFRFDALTKETILKFPRTKPVLVVK